MRKMSKMGKCQNEIRRNLVESARSEEENTRRCVKARQKRRLEYDDGE